MFVEIPTAVWGQIRFDRFPQSSFFRFFWESQFYFCSALLIGWDLCMHTANAGVIGACNSKEHPQTFEILLVSHLNRSTARGFPLPRRGTAAVLLVYKKRVTQLQILSYFFSFPCLHFVHISRVSKHAEYLDGRGNFGPRAVRARSARMAM